MGKNMPVEPAQYGPGTDMLAPHYLKDNKYWHRLTSFQKRYVVLWFNSQENKMTRAECYKIAYKKPDDFPKSLASKLAYGVLRSRNVSNCIKFINDHLIDEAAESINQLLRWDKEAAFFDPRDALDDDGKFLPLKDMPLHVARQIKKATRRENQHGTVSWTYEFHNGEEARKRIAKHSGYADVNRVQLSGGLDNKTTVAVDSEKLLKERGIPIPVLPTSDINVE